MYCIHRHKQNLTSQHSRSAKIFELYAFFKWKIIKNAEGTLIFLTMCIDQIFLLYDKQNFPCFSYWRNRNRILCCDAAQQTHFCVYMRYSCIEHPASCLKYTLTATDRKNPYSNSTPTINAKLSKINVKLSTLHKINCFTFLTLSLYRIRFSYTYLNHSYYAMNYLRVRTC